MKRIFTIVVLIASLVFTSCEDFLTEDVRGQLNVDTYYKSIEEYLGVYDDVEFAVDNCGFTSFVEEAKFLLKKYCHIKLNMLQSFVIFFTSKITKLRCGWSFTCKKYNKTL